MNNKPDSIYRPWVLPIYKPAGDLSYDIIRDFKKRVPKPHGKIGHFGTLDPFAEGVLVLGGNGGQKLNDFIHDWFPKTYIAAGVLGQKTDTGDLTEEGKRSLKIDLDFPKINFSQAEMQNLWTQKFLGEYLQVPPMYSASKHEGRPLHFYARQGIKIDKPPVSRKIFELKVLEVNWPQVKFEVTVSSGTYIRKLFEDMALVLGTFGVLSELQRIKMGPFELENSLTQENWPTREGWNWQELPQIYEQVPLKQIHLNERGSYLYGNGQNIDLIEYLHRETVPNDSLESLSGYSWVFSNDQELFGLGKIAGNRIAPEFNFPR